MLSRRFEAEEKERCGRDPFLGLPSVTFTVIQSPPPGSPPQLNVMPGEAVGYVDIRTTLAQDHDAVRERLRGILAELAAQDPDFKADIEFIEDRPVVGISRDEPIARVSAEAFREITGREPVWNGVPGRHGRHISQRLEEHPLPGQRSRAAPHPPPGGRICRDR